MFIKVPKSGEMLSFAESFTLRLPCGEGSVPTVELKKAEPQLREEEEEEEITNPILRLKGRKRRRIVDLDKSAQKKRRKEDEEDDECSM